MKAMPAGKFKAQCLRVMDRVQATRVPVLITKRGKPVAKLVPVDEFRSEVFDSLKGKIEILGDIVSPVVPPEDWEALK
jgi:prevent-host-death family protein